MRMGKTRLFIVFLFLMTLLLLSTTASLAETHVTLTDLHYGREAFSLHEKNQFNFVTFMGHEWRFDESLAYEGASYFAEVHTHDYGIANSEYASFPRTKGGKTRAVYEYTIHHEDFTAEPGNENVQMAEIAFYIPYPTTLYAGVGNRTTGEYIFAEPVSFSDTYTLSIFMPRDEEGMPAIVDRIYLYSYEYNGEMRYYALSLYMDYESFDASYPKTPDIKEKADPKTEKEKEPVKEIRSIAYKALINYLEKNEIPPQSIIDMATWYDDLTEDDLRLLFGRYHYSYPLIESEFEQAGASFDHTAFEDLPGFTFYPDDELWFCENSHITQLENGLLKTHITVSGSENEPFGPPTFCLTYSDSAKGASAAGISVVYVHVDGATYALPISASVFNTFASFLNSESAESLVRAMSNADEMAIAFDLSGDLITVGISGEDYASAIRPIVNAIVSSNLYSVIELYDKERENADPHAFVSVADYGFGENSIVMRLMDEPGMNAVYTDKVSWTYGLPYTTTLGGNNLDCALSFSGEDETVITEPTLSYSLTSPDGAVIDIAGISFRIDGTVYDVNKRASLSTSTAVKKDGTYVVSSSASDSSGAENAPDYIAALANAETASVIVNFSDGSTLEKTIQDDDLAITLKDAAIKSTEIFFR